MLTRNLYRCDEVRSALMYAIKRGRPREALAWCRELEMREAWTVLVETWMWHVLAAEPTWLYRCVRVESMNQDDLLDACWDLATIEGRDNSLWWTLVSPSNHKQEVGEFRSALAHGRVADAWSLVTTGHVSEAEARRAVAPSSLQRVLTHLGIPLSRVDLCASIILSCSPRRRRRPPPRPRDPVEPGRRASRIYPIPVECLYGLTQRGCSLQTTSTIGDLWALESVLAQSPAWTPLLTVAKQSDEALEAFYQTYFPDDIPDEWSRKDQGLSHGPGVLRASEELSYAKLGRIWFTAPCRFTEWSEWSNDVDPRALTSPLAFHHAADISSHLLVTE